jgi:hypothetical protein
MKYFCFLIAFWAAHAQTREIGVLAGGGFLPGVSVQGAPGSLAAGFQNGPAAGVSFTHNLYSHWRGEIRYLFEQRNLRLTSGSESAEFAGRAHVLQYDSLYHLHPRNVKVRPYVAVGGGMKLFQGTGTEAAYQPLMQYAYLTRTRELKPMLSFGGGFKIALRGRMAATFDFRDQVTTFPTKLITPAPGMTINSWLHDFVPTVGLDWSF